MRIRSDERPPHEVTFAKGFHMGVTEVTQEQWQAVMGSKPSKFTGPKRPVRR
jgi:formylglycine-generating enzyme required for sulfatase activity